MADIKTKDPKVKDALDNVRSAAQELHGAISDAAAQRGGAMKADLEAIPQKAKAVAESLKSSMTGRNDASKKYMTDAITYLEATNKLAVDALKSSGQAFQSSVRQALADARAASQKVSEAVAASRSASAKSPQK
jgi:hypothetical protein